MKNLLYSLKKEKKVASIFTNINNTDVCSTGFIGNVSDEFIILKHISTLGKYDGFLLKRIEKVYRIDFDGKYEKKLKFLYNIQNQIHQEITENCSSLILDIIDFAKKNIFVVSLELHDSFQDDIQGYIKEVRNGKLEVQLLDDYGKENGISTINISDITHLSCDTDNEMMLKLLFENKN